MMISGKIHRLIQSDGEAAERDFLRCDSACSARKVHGEVQPRKETFMSRMENAGQGQGNMGEGSMGQAASDVQQNIRDMGSQIRDAATGKYGELRDQAQEYYEQGRQQAMEWEQGLEDYVREKPLQSLLIAAGVGMLLGIIWKRS
jgi:ElaB/YqjD/DUF883 family membrane-anchored ribosome-binding protein